MSREEFAVGSRVRDEDNTQKGTVIGHSAKEAEIVAVEWDDGELEKVDYNCLVLVDTALEADFEKIEAAMSQAAAKLNEAQALAAKHGKDLYNLHYEGDLSFSEMFHALDNAGWSSSSMRC